MTNQMLHGAPIDCRGKFHKLEDVEHWDEDEEVEEAAEHEAEPLAQKRKPKKTVPSGSTTRRAVVRNVQLQGRLRATGHSSLRLAGRSTTVKAPLVILLTL